MQPSQRTNSSLLARFKTLRLSAADRQNEPVEFTRRLSEDVISPRVAVISPVEVISVPLKDAIEQGKIKEALFVLPGEKKVKRKFQTLVSGFQVNNYALQTSTEDGKKSAYTDHFPADKYAIFADAVNQQEHGNYCRSIAIADGCGLGDGASEAARFAVKLSMKSLQIEKLNPRLIAALQVDCLMKIQQNLVEGYNTNQMKFGQTTLTIVTVAQNRLITTWIGDCKVFLLRQSEKNNKNHVLVDITDSNRGAHPGNCGGFLGYDVNPSWGNVHSAFVELAAGDIVIGCTDGVYDNFDPMFEGKIPSDFGHNEEKWNPKNQEHLAIRQAQRIERLKSIVLGKPMREIPGAIQEYISQHTHNQKKFMHENPQERQPEDFKTYPGKPDHASAFVIEVLEKTRGSVKK